MKHIIATLLLVLPLVSLADTEGTTKWKQLFSDMNVVRNGWCEEGDTGPDGLVEFRSKSGKRGYEIFTRTGHYIFVEVPAGKRVERRYFSGTRASDGPGKIRFDATEHKDATAWEQSMGNQKILIMLYFPNMETLPSGCAWSKRVYR